MGISFLTLFDKIIGENKFGGLLKSSPTLMLKYLCFCVACGLMHLQLHLSWKRDH